MKITFVSLFPHLLEFYFKDSILARALNKDTFSLDFQNPRTFSKDKYKKVDDHKIGGGAEPLMRVAPLFECLEQIHQKESSSHFISLSPSAKNFNQKDAKRLSQKSNLVFICGRYEGINERVVEGFANELFGVGDFILTGGELPALCLCDAILRNVNRVFGNSQSLEEGSFENHLLEAPFFAKPLIFEKNLKKFYTNSMFLEGNHAKIAALKNTLASCKAKFLRPDLFLECERRI